MMAATRRFENLDWESIQKEYVAGQLSLKEIGRQHGCSDTAIRLKAKEFGWQRRLDEKVRAEILAKLLREELREKKQLQASDEEIIEAAAERGAAVVRVQRADIEKLRAVEMRLLKELGDEDNPPTKSFCSVTQGVVEITPIPIPVTERASSLMALANVQHRRIQLERQAYSLGPDTGDPLSSFSEFLALIDGRGKKLPGGDNE